MGDLQERKLLKIGKLLCWTELRENTRTVRTERSVGEAATKKIEDLRRKEFVWCLLVRQTPRKAGSHPRFSQHCQLASPHPPHLTGHGTHDSPIPRLTLPLPLLSFFLHCFACAPYLFLPIHEGYQFCNICSYCDFLLVYKIGAQRS